MSGDTYRTAEAPGLPGGRACPLCTSIVGCVESQGESGFIWVMQDKRGLSEDPQFCLPDPAKLLNWGPKRCCTKEPMLILNPIIFFQEEYKKALSIPRGRVAKFIYNRQITEEKVFPAEELKLSLSCRTLRFPEAGKLG